MKIHDCTLCLLPKGYDIGQVVKLYKLLCQLPIIVEYPSELQIFLKIANVVNSNSQVVQELPKKDEVIIPSFKKYKVAEERIVFPANDLGIAGAVATCEFLARGQVRTAFGGLGNTAATEELLLTLFTMGKLQQVAILKILPKITVLWKKITGNKVPARKPVIGRNIFVVESGIHVDGIIKNPELYEPFAPEIIGCKRKIVLGTHSGRNSIKEKLKELKLSYSEKRMDTILQYIQEESRRLKRNISDKEFVLAWEDGDGRKNSVC